MSSWSNGGTRSRSWLQHCSPSQKVAGSIFDGIICNYYWHNPSGCTMAPGPIQILTEMNTRNIAWEVKWSVLMTDNISTYMCRFSWDLGASISWILSETAQACIGMTSSSFCYEKIINWAIYLHCHYRCFCHYEINSVPKFTLFLCCSYQNISHTHLPLPTAVNLKMCGGPRSHNVFIKLHSSGFQLETRVPAEKRSELLKVHFFPHAKNS